MKVKDVVATAAALSLVSMNLLAAVIPGRWEKMETIPVGSPIAVTLKAGTRIEGVFSGMSPDEVTISTPDRREWNLPKLHIERVSRPREDGDSALNGTLLGLAAGLAVGVVAVTLDTAGEFISAPGGSSVEIAARSTGNSSEIGVLVGAGAIGTLFGFLIDVSHDQSRIRQDLLYRAR